MNSKDLPKEKLRQFILVGLLTAVALGVLGFGLIKLQYDNLADLARQKAAVQSELQQMQDAIKRANVVKAGLDEDGRTLAGLEEGMASGDLLSWIYNTVSRVAPPYKVEIPLFSQPVRGDVSLFPRFHYKQASFTVQGTAYFHDFGRFIADFENQFPHIRVLNLDLAPASSSVPGEQEKLSFKMDIVTLVKPNPS